ncbi:MAG: acetyl-CoA carboxylase carboxyltransferase subunit alpha [Verrucomicrobia bacterium]|nr:acetyl-CoA carboxylase carboxyltransferase subunit alpha [Verrucomicrobiota bacterium]
MRSTGHKLITYDFEKPILELERKLEELRRMATEQKVDLHDQIAAMEKTVEETKQNVYTNLSAWQRVQLARHPRRPYTLDYLGAIATDFIELHGDRRFSDDHAIVGGFATIDDIRVVVVGHQKGRDTKENIMRNFGCAHPEGYRKAMRLMQMAERFNLPIVTIIDTPGAYPGVGAEERHIAEAIAANLRDMMGLRVPIVAAVIGEGGSGGALGIGIANRVLIMENSYYSVISPEGCAAILWKDRAATPKAAEALKLSAKDLLELKLVDEIIPEPLGGAHRDPVKAAAALKSALLTHLRELMSQTTDQVLEQRYNKFRAMGQFDFVVPGGNV